MSNTLTKYVSNAINSDVAQDSMRTTDVNGCLTVKDQIITSAGVFPYLGKEIPNHEELGFDANTEYKGLRPSDEIKKSLSTFNNMTFTSDHEIVSCDNPNKDIWIGSLGNDVYYDDSDDKMKATITFTDQKAIDKLLNGKKGLSAAYRYIPVVQKGTYKGESYDFIMTNLQANHVAHVAKPRDKSAIVNDSADLINNRSEYMNKYTKALMALDGELDEGSIADAILDLMQSDSSLEEKKKGLIALLKKSATPVEDEDNEEDDKPKKKDKDVAEDEDEDDEDGKKNKTKDEKPAMDSKQILEIAKQHVNSIMEHQEAIKIGEKLLGGVNTIALDSADKIYNAILKQNNRNVAGINLAGKKAMVALLQEQMSMTSNQSKIAMDSSLLMETNDAFSKQFEGVF